MNLKKNETSRVRHGFTVVELLVVIIVIGILITISGLAYRNIRKDSVEANLKGDLTSANSQLDRYKLENGEYPFDVSLIEKSSDTQFVYSTGGPTSYCLEATSTADDVGSFYITESGDIKKGVCPGAGPIVGLDCPTGFIPVPGNSTFNQSEFCVMKYEAKNVGGVATSQAAGTPWVSITRADAITAAQNACAGCNMISQAQWLTIAHDVMSVDSNWTGGSVGIGSMYRGHSDGNPDNALAASTNDSNGYHGTGNSEPSEQRRTLTLSNGEVIWDLAGNAWSFVRESVPGTGVPNTHPGWANYNKVEDKGSLTPNIYPSYGTPAAGNWNHEQGIGQLNAPGDGYTGMVFTRGGMWGYGNVSGVFTLLINPNDISYAVGFRATR